MSLHHLGIAHFPVLHRQFSPTASTFSVPSPARDLTQDSKDVLVERLNDLVLRLSKDSSLEDNAVPAIHSEVDKIELLLHGGERRRGSHGTENTRLSVEDDTFWGPRSPTQSLRLRRPVIIRGSPRQAAQNESPMTPAKAVELAKAAEELASQLTKTVAELQTRKEESDHIHDLLVTRAEKAAERILLLEYRISEMADDFEANQSELKYLQIQLQAIEAQCSQYVPRSDDQELSDSIMNWKIDWEDIEKLSKERRERCQIAPTHEDGTKALAISLQTEHKLAMIQKVV